MPNPIAVGSVERERSDKCVPPPGAAAAPGRRPAAGATAGHRGGCAAAGARGAGASCLCLTRLASRPGRWAWGGVGRWLGRWRPVSARSAATTAHERVQAGMCGNANGEPVGSAATGEVAPHRAALAVAQTPRAAPVLHNESPQLWNIGRHERP